MGGLSPPAVFLDGGAGGGISEAAEELRLSQPTISAQIRQLEASLGERLFQKQGRTLVPIDVGRLERERPPGHPARTPSSIIEQDINRFYGVRVVGRTSAVRERYYAISVERRLKHPGVIAITSAAREEVFR